MARLDFPNPPRWFTTDAMRVLASDIFQAVGCRAADADEIADHIVESDIAGIPSHGVDRILQYADEFQTGKRDPRAAPRLSQNARGGWIVDGGNGLGIRTMRFALEDGRRRAVETGLSATAVVNVGHTGRLGAFCEESANEGFLTIVLGGGGRREWPQVAPHGGRAGLLPTNPYAIGIPGGARGSVILDFATSAIAGGWIYAARRGGGLLPPNAVIDSDGNPTRDPKDYFDGGAILPAAGPKGYALALAAEVIGEAMLGPVDGELNWLVLTLDTGLYAEASTMGRVAEEILSEVRAAPPAPGFEKVEVPGERERDQAQAAKGVVAVPEMTWRRIVELADTLGISAPAEAVGR